MSETATKPAYSTAVGMALFVGASGAVSCELDTQWIVGKIVRGQLELDADGSAEFDAEMAGWREISHQALLNCPAWE
jgi:hypothetical protein